MNSRLAMLLALVALLGGPLVGGQTAPTQASLGADPARGLLQQLERIVQSGDRPAFESLLTDAARRSDAARFTETEIVPGVTRVVLRERAREPLPGTLPGNGYRLSVDAFTEFGDRARSATWLLDVKRIGSDADDVWRIADERKLSVVENLYRLALDPARQFDAHNLTISVDDFELTLVEGSVFVAQVDQGVTALILLGRSDLRFHPGPAIEKGQLKIFCGAEALHTRVDAAFIRVNPGDADTLIETSRMTPRHVDARDLRRAEEVFREEVVKTYAVDLSDLSRDLWSLVPASGDFLAELRTQRYDTLTFSKSSAEAEDLSFFDRKRRKNISVYASPGALARRGRTFNEDDFTTYDVLDYDIDLQLSPERLWLDARTTMRIRVATSAMNSLTLRLAEPLVVSSIVSDRFGRLFGVRVRNQNSIFVNLPAAVLKDDELTLTFTYAGRLEPQREDSESGGQGRQGGDRGGPPLDETMVLRREPSLLYSNRSYWYPQGTITDYATARIRVTVPAGYACVASGKLAAGSPSPVVARDSTVLRTRYEFDASKPVRYLAFLVSKFVATEGVAVPLESGADFNLSVQANPRQVRRGRELAVRARDIAQFYDSIVGDAPYASFTIGVIEGDLPGGHSPGYFAAVRQPLPDTPLVWRNDPAAFDDIPEFVIAHEMAHQWWGQAVGWRNYHEQWISEGFAQYFAALYAQHARGDEAFASMLRQFRRWGMQRSDEGPIYLGYRLGHLRGDSRVFRALVYNKSAAVLHMLRRLLGDEAFFRGVRRFYESSRFRKVGTDDFRTVMEIETERSLERFFEQWIYGSSLPRLKFSYRVEPVGGVRAVGPVGNDQQAVLHIEQVGEVFDVPVTVTLTYASRKEEQVIVPVTEQVVDFPVRLAGPLRSAEISRDDGTLAEIVKD